jgi:nucleoid DNA-binding protein
MIPKKARKFYKQTAEDLEIQESLVEDFVEFYYKNIRHNLSNLVHPRINVEGLGHFTVKPSWVRRAIERISKALEKHDTSTFGAYSKKVRLEHTLELLIELEKKIVLEEQRKETFKKTKYEGGSKDNLGE